MKKEGPWSCRGKTSLSSGDGVTGGKHPGLGIPWEICCFSSVRSKKSFTDLPKETGVELVPSCASKE